MPPIALTYRPASSSCLHSGGGERMTADEGRLRVSECRAKRVFALPNRWSSESHQACLRSTSGRLLPTGRKNGRVVTEVGVANGSCFNRARALLACYRKATGRRDSGNGDARRLNNANRAKIMAESFGHYNNFATLSLSLSLSLSGTHLQ